MLTPEQIGLLRDKLGLWRHQAETGSDDWRDYNRRAAEALNELLCGFIRLEGQLRVQTAMVVSQAEMISRFKRYLSDCEACAGTGKIEHEAVYTGPNPCSASVETCDHCEGLGVEL